MINSIYFLPHGMQLIPGLEVPYNENFRNLHNHMTKISKTMEEDQSELMILITPHGLNLEEKMLAYEHDTYQGNYFKILPQLSVVHGEIVEARQWNGDSEELIKLKSYLLENGIEIESVIQGGSNYPLTLAWGETVPLYYLPDSLNPKIIVIGIPRSRHTNIQGIQQLLQLFGVLIVEFYQSHTKEVSLIFSGDLSHTHDGDGPYGYHNSSKKFDQVVQKWAINPSEEFFNVLLNLQNTALACGMAGISMLQGIFSKYPPNHVFSFYDVPTYFGMIIGQWKI